MRHDFVFILPIEVYFDEVMLEKLNHEEKRNAEKIRCCATRRQYVLAHWLKAMALSFYTGIPPNRLEYENNVYGKPSLINSASEIYFNISHTEGYIAMMLSNRHEVGIDIETPNEKIEVEAIVDFTFHPDEISALQKEGISIGTFYQYWTLKEAASKALGRGISLPFNTILTKKHTDQYYQYIDTNGKCWSLVHVILPAGKHLSFCCSEVRNTSILLTCGERQEIFNFYSNPIY